MIRERFPFKASERFALAFVTGNAELLTGDGSLRGSSARADEKSESVSVYAERQANR